MSSHLAAFSRQDNFIHTNVTCRQLYRGVQTSKGEVMTSDGLIMESGLKLSQANELHDALMEGELHTWWLPNLDETFETCETSSVAVSSNDRGDSPLHPGCPVSLPRQTQRIGPDVNSYSPAFSSTLYDDMISDRVRDINSSSAAAGEPIDNDSSGEGYAVGANLPETFLAGPNTKPLLPQSRSEPQKKRRCC